MSTVTSIQFNLVARPHGEPTSDDVVRVEVTLPALADGVWPFAGYTMTGFSNEEERLSGLAEKAPWLVEDRLVELGADYSSGDAFQPHSIIDRNLYTGQNPASSSELATAVIAAAAGK